MQASTPKENRLGTSLAYGKNRENPRAFSRTRRRRLETCDEMRQSVVACVPSPTQFQSLNQRRYLHICWFISLVIFLLSLCVDSTVRHNKSRVTFRWSSRVLHHLLLLLLLWLVSQEALSQKTSSQKHTTAEQIPISARWPFQLHHMAKKYWENPTTTPMPTARKGGTDI